MSSSGESSWAVATSALATVESGPRIGENGWMTRSIAKAMIKRSAKAFNPSAIIGGLGWSHTQLIIKAAA
jgi:hypothetical protein